MNKFVNWLKKICGMRYEQDIISVTLVHEISHFDFHINERRMVFRKSDGIDLKLVSDKHIEVIWKYPGKGDYHFLIPFSNIKSIRLI